MAVTKRAQSELLTTDWTWSSEINGAWPHSTLQAAAACESARRLISIDQTLKTILSRLDALGSDGIHELIRRENTSARIRERQRRKQAAAKRLKTIAAKKASA